MRFFPKLSRKDPPRCTSVLVVDEDGVRRAFADGRIESVRWSELSAVRILTTSAGPFAEDVFFLLEGGAASGCVVPQCEATGTDLLARLQGLPGFDHMAVITAMGSTQDALFPCWSRALTASRKG